MIGFRYRLRNVAMRIVEKEFTAEGITFPPGSFIVPGPVGAAARSAVKELGLTAAALSALPSVPTHEAGAPRIAIYSQWNGTQDLGWYRLTFDDFGIPYDLIYKEQVKRGDLAAKYDVIVMAAQSINRQSVLQAPLSRAQPYQRSEKYRFLGMYGDTPDMSGGFSWKVSRRSGSSSRAGRRSSRPATPSGSRSSSAGPGRSTWNRSRA